MDAETPDRELLERWRDGDLVAARRLFARHSASVGRVFRYKADDVLEDLVQQTFLHCLERKDAIDDRGLRGYLLGIAYNVLRKHFEQRMGPRGRIDPVVTSLAELQPASATSVLARSRAQTLVLEAMRTLPLEFQVALELFYWEDMTAPEIAGVLGVPEGTVRSRLRLGRDRLRARLAQLDPDEPVDLDATARSTRE